jgi:hypothetical protein
LELKKKILASFYNEESDVGNQIKTDNENFKDNIKKSGKFNNKSSKRKKNKNIKESLTNERLQAYGINAKIFIKPKKN